MAVTCVVRVASTIPLPSSPERIHRLRVDAPLLLADGLAALLLEHLDGTPGPDAAVLDLLAQPDPQRVQTLPGVGVPVRLDPAVPVGDGRGVVALDLEPVVVGRRGQWAAEQQGDQQAARPWHGSSVLVRLTAGYPRSSSGIGLRPGARRVTARALPLLFEHSQG